MNRHLTQTFPATFLLFITGVSGALYGGFIFPTSNTNITLSELKVSVGSEFTANCTFTLSYRGRLNASFLYFKYPRKQLGTIERVLNGKTRQLSIPAMQKTDSGIYYCYLNETSIGGKETSSESFAMVIVKEAPTAVTNVSCVIDNFESMNCSWCQHKKPAAMTKFRLQWSEGSSSGTCGSTLCYCVFCRGDCTDGQQHALKQNVSYLMNFTSVNDFGRVRSVAVIHTSQHIVKLRPLLHLEAVSYTSQSVQLNWTQPEGFDPKWFDIIYEVQCEGPWKDEPKVTVELTNDLSHLLTNLHPSTRYIIRVRSRPASGHLWSYPLTTNVTTAQEAPSVPPTIPPGSFRIQPCSRENEDCRNVTIFWQSIAEEYRNGVILDYELSFYVVQHSPPSASYLKTSLLSATLPHLDGRHGYTITVQANNDGGKSPVATVFIPCNEDLPRPPVDVVAESNENRSHISFSWAPPTAPVTNYTFFWCEQLEHSQHGCQGPIQYRVLAGNVTEMVHSVRSDTDLYTLSVNSDTGSSGMTRDWICVYDYNGLPAKPVFSFDGGVGARNITLSWQRPVCSTRNRGQVLNYKLELWKVNHDAMLEEFELPASVDSYTVTNLRPYTNYTFKMAAVANIGRGEFSMKQVRTLESKPDDPPTDLEGFLVSDHQVALRWSNPRTSNGVIREYEIIARVDGQEVLHETVRRTNYTCEVSGGVTYTFTVVAINGVGRSSEATPISIVTPVRAPAQIRLHQIRLDQFNETVATVMWTRPLPSNGPIDNYVIQCDLRDEGNVRLMTCNDTASGNETEMHIVVDCNDMKVFMDVRVVAVNYNGMEPLYGSWSDVKTVAMCTNPGGATDWTMIILISLGVIVFFTILGVLYGIWRYRRHINKHLQIKGPHRVSSERGLIEGENEHSGTISPDSISNTSDDSTVASVADPYMTCGTTSSPRNNYISESNSTSVGTYNGSVSNNLLIPHETESGTDVSGSGRDGEGSYSKAVILSMEPDGPAARLFPMSSSSSGAEYELETMSVPETATSGKAVDDAPQQQNVSKVNKDGAALSRSDLTDSDKVAMPHCIGTVNKTVSPPHFTSNDNRCDTTKMQVIIGNPKEVTVFMAARQPDAAVALNSENRDDWAASLETYL